MSQVYHSNARTNSYIRDIIQKSNLSNLELSKKLSVNKKLYLNGEIGILLTIRVLNLIISNML